MRTPVARLVTSFALVATLATSGCVTNRSRANATPPLGPLAISWNVAANRFEPGESVRFPMRARGSMLEESASLAVHVIPAGNVCLESPVRLDLPASVNRYLGREFVLQFRTLGPGRGAIYLIAQARDEAGGLLFQTEAVTVTVGSWPDGVWAASTPKAVEYDRASWLASLKRSERDRLQGQPFPQAAPCEGGPVSGAKAPLVAPPQVINNFVAWHPGGRSLLYGHQGTDNWSGSDPIFSRLSLDQPDAPEQVSLHPMKQASWSPDGSRAVTVGRRPVPGETRTEQTILLDGKPLLPQGAGNDPILVGWPDLHTVSFFTLDLENKFFLLDVDSRAVKEFDVGRANRFTWDRSGTRVVWQEGTKYAKFRIWDRGTGALVTLAELPGTYQWFEAWSDDGDSLLFTAWDDHPYYVGLRWPPNRVDLYKLTLSTGSLERIARQAAMAAWSGDRIAYLSLEPSLTLKVIGGPEEWSAELGPASAEVLNDPDDYRPVFAGPYISYRTVADESMVSPANRHDPRPLYEGAGVRLYFSPDGGHAALLTETYPATMLLLRNPHQGR